MNHKLSGYVKSMFDGSYGHFQMFDGLTGPHDTV